LSGKGGELAPVVADLSAMDAALKQFNTTGANPFPALFAGIAASLTGGTAEFDAATGAFTAKWEAFQVEMSKTGEIEIHPNYKFIDDSMGSLKIVQQVNDLGNSLRAKLGQKPISLDQPMTIKPLWSDSEYEPFDINKWIMSKMGGKPYEWKPKVKVQPEPKVVDGFDLGEWLKSALGGASGAAADTLNSAAATIGIGVDATINAVAEVTADWGETWTQGYGVLADAVANWGTTWTTTYSVMSEVSADWGEVWTTVYKAVASITPDWGDTWSKAYSVTVTLFKRWFGGEPGANETGPLPDAGGFNATGTASWRGGLSWVGENGPELVALPGGSRVWNNRESMAMAGAGGPQVVINANVSDAIDLEVLARRVGQYLRRG
jgi:hypothetical protein